MSIPRVLALGLATAAMMSVTPGGPTSGSPYQDVRVSIPTNQPAPRTVTTVASARNETERVSEMHAAPHARWRKVWDGKNRTPGDRAHKRMKLRRASGRKP